MIILNCNNICLSFGITEILRNISFSINEGERVGVVGVNGAGKSTLFKVVSQMLTPDNGEIYVAKSKSIGYLQQNSGLDTESSIWDCLMSTYADLIAMEERIKKLEALISVEKQDDKLSSLMKEYASLTDTFSRKGGYEYNSRVKGVLRGLGFSDPQFSLKVSSLSGGQKTRLALAKLLLEEPDILLLDEPTNHLDISALEWLEDYLKNYRKTIMLISHDRYFLDSVTNRTLEIENSTCKLYNGNYSQYVNQKAVDREIQQKHYELQQKEIARLEAFIEQQRRWNRERNIIAAESRQKAIDRMEKIDKPKDLPGKINIKLKSGIVSGNDVLFIENVSKEYPGKPLFSNVSFKIRKSEKVFILGPNGCGKSTLLKIITGFIEKCSGSVEFGHKVQVGYYDQEHGDLDDNNCVIDEVWKANDSLTQTEVRNALASFLFKGEDVLKPLSILSGGEKSRVSLVKLMLSSANLLILDEPTNHLDINSREILEESLLNYDGTILAVSHDRYFINKLATRIIEIGGSDFLDYTGNYTGYADYRVKNRKSGSQDVEEQKLSSAKLEHLTSKEEKSRKRRLEKRLSETEKGIYETETRLDEISNEMCLQEVSSDHVKLMQLHEEEAILKQKLEELYKTWEELETENATVG